jgi:hypothetical protein
VLQHLHAENRGEGVVGEGELLQVSLEIASAASSAAEQEPRMVDVAADDLTAVGNEFEDEIPGATPGVEDTISHRQISQSAQAEFIQMPSPANGIPSGEGFILTAAIGIVVRSAHSAAILLSPVTTRNTGVAKWGSCRLPQI